MNSIAIDKVKSPPTLLLPHTDSQKPLHLTVRLQVMIACVGGVIL